MDAPQIRWHAFVLQSRKGFAGTGTRRLLITGTAWNQFRY